MKDIELNIQNSFIEEREFEAIKGQVEYAHKLLHEKTGLGSDFLGWVNYPKEHRRIELERLKETANAIRRSSDVFLVLGIGGSYLGARAVIESLTHSFRDILPSEKRNGPHIMYLGNNLSSSYMSELLEALEGKRVSVNVISKSGKTLETSIAFRLIRDFMLKTYGEKSKERIVVTTSRENSAIGELAKKEGYQTFYLPDDIGGRYSVLTPVGLLPMAVAGIDVDELMRGAKDAMAEYGNLELEKNECYRYAAIRNIFNRRGLDVELLVTYEPSLAHFQEWWKQLFGESEGKDEKGIFPASVCFTTDLHSLGQYVQDGKKLLFETVLNVARPKKDLVIPSQEGMDDGLDYLEGKSIDFVNKSAMQGTAKAHVEGNVPNIQINIPEMNEYFIGKMIYFFQKACGISGYLLGVNPFDQPGVELYKKNMTDILKKQSRPVLKYRYRKEHRIV